MNIKHGKVTTEGDDLYYEIRGQGQPLLMIPGGGGDGGAYAAVADLLSDEFKVITYDRRANARSTMHDPHHFDISQQSRDAVAIIHAASEDSAVIFGNSSGAVIALDIAKTQPQAAMAIVAHEPPLVHIHPDREKWERFFRSVYNTAFRFGNIAAMLRFSFGIAVPFDYSFGKAVMAVRAARKARALSREPYRDQKETIEFFLKQEMIPVTNYEPDIETIKGNGVKVVMAAGKRSLERKRFYAETASILAKRLGCEFIEFPGHHGSFVEIPAEWSATLRQTLRTTHQHLAPS